MLTGLTMTARRNDCDYTRSCSRSFRVRNILNQKPINIIGISAYYHDSAAARIISSARIPLGRESSQSSISDSAQPTPVTKIDSLREQSGPFHSPDRHLAPADFFNHFVAVQNTHTNP